MLFAPFLWVLFVIFLFCYGPNSDWLTKWGGWLLGGSFVLMTVLTFI